MYSLDNAFNELIDKIRDPDALNPAKSDPVFYFAYPPELMLDLKKHLHAGRPGYGKPILMSRRVSLADILWDMVDKSGRWDLWLELEAEADADQINEAVRDVLRQGDAFVDRVAEVVESTPEDTVVLLTEAELLHPYFRTRTIESRLHDKVKTPTVIFYPRQTVRPIRTSFPRFLSGRRQLPVDAAWRSLMSATIRQVFSPRRPIDRTIEKVIDYYAQEEDRLAREVAEYEVTDNIESCFRKFLDVFGEGVRGGQVTEVGIWVSGFYGSGKSSFTKYLGASLDPTRTVQDKPFLDLLCDRFPRNEIPAALRTVSKKHPTAVVLLDLGAEQLAESAAAPVSTVLYWKVLQWAGFSKEKKTAQLEFTLDRRGKYDDFKRKYKERYKGEWNEIHNDPLIGVARAAEIVPGVLPDDFPTPESFRGLRFEEARDVRDLAREIIDICRHKTGHENILLLVDEAGQYVAPRGELILNLDGLARNLKELGKGKVWIAATGQQTLSEIVEKAAHNSAELNKLRDRFPIFHPP